MTTEVLGSASLNLVVNTDDMVAGVERAKRSVSGMSQAAQSEYNKLNAAEKRRVDSLIKQADTLGLNRQQMLAYNATMRTSGAVQAELLARIKATEAATKSGAAAFNQYGVSAKQTAAAMRGVPAQLTDIFTSLQGGQNPLTVLLQQGGQLKDMFGGIVPAARALGSSLLGLVNPYTVTAAAAGALALAWVKGQKEAERFNEALIMTGNFAGTTAADLAALASEMDNLEGVTRGAAAATLAQVAATGQFTGEQLKLVSETAVEWQAATGRAIKDTVAEFEELRKDPVTAILKLNDTYHFLTTTQLERIRALQDEGREQEAVTEAMRAFADMADGRLPKIRDNVNALGAAWRAVKENLAEVGDELTNIGSQEMPDWMRGLIANTAGALPVVGQTFGSRQFINGALAGLTRTGPDFSNVVGGSSATMVDSAKERERQRFLSEEVRYLDESAKKRREIADVEKLVTRGVINRVEATKRIGQIEADYAEKAKRSGSGRSRTRKAELTDAEKAAKQLQSMNAQLDRQIALYGDTSLAAAARYEVERGGLVALTQAEKDAYVAKAQKLDAMREEKEIADDILRLNRNIAASEVDQQRSNDADLMALSGMGRGEYQRAQRRLAIEYRYLDEVEALRQRETDTTSDAYRAQEALLRDSRDRSLQVEANYQQQRAALMGNWQLGASDAARDFMEQNADIAGQVYDMWTNAFNGIADVMVDFLATGKGDWRGFFDDLHRMILEFIVKQQLTKWMQNLGSMDANSGGGGFMQFLGSLFQSGSGGGWGGIAKGGAFGGGRKIEEFAMGGVFGNATMFQHGGKLGVLGEAGPEAIMPLKRGPDGKLGVKVNGGNTAQGGTVLNQTFVVQGTPDSRTAGQMARESGRAAARELRRTGG